MKQKTAQTTAQVERQTSKMSKSYSKVGVAIKGTLAALSATALVMFGKSCIDLGSDLQEVQNVVDVTFGDMNRQVNAFSKNAIAQFGLSELTAKKYMGTYGAMAKAFGITGQAGYEMSAAITGLTGDVASFYNLSTDEAYTKLSSIFTGETEAIKHLGVAMTQTALNQYALNNGFGKTTAKMTEQEKVMLRYQFVMSSLSDASGDFARTSGSWANQTRVLSLQFDQLRATIGQGLINAFTPVIKVINAILAKLQTLASYFKAFTAALFGDASGESSIGSAVNAMAGAAGASGAVADHMGSAAKSAESMKKSLAAFDELNNLSSNSGSGGSGGGGAGETPDFGNMSGTLFGEVEVNPNVEAAVAKLKEALESLKNTAIPTTDAVKKLWDEGLALLGTFTWTALKDFGEYFLKPLGVWTLGEGLPRFIELTNNFLKSINWAEINGALKNFWGALEPFAENIGRGLLDFYEDLTGIGADFINAVVPGGLNGIAEALKKISPEQTEKIGYALGILATAFLGFKTVGTVITFFEPLIRLLSGPAVIKATKGIGGLVSGIGKFLGIGKLLTKFKPFATISADLALSGASLPQLLKGLVLTPLTTFFTSTVPTALSGLAGSVGSAFGLTGTAAVSAGGAAILAAVAAVVAAIVYAVTHWGEIKEFFTVTVPEWWKGTVIPFFEQIPGWFREVWEKTKGFFIEKWNGMIDWFQEVPGRVSEVIDDIVEWFDGLPGRIGYAIGFAIGTIITWAADIASTVATEIPKIIEKIVTFFAELPGKIYDAIITFRDHIIQWGSEMWAIFSQKVSEIITNVVTFFSELPDKIYQKLVLFKHTISAWKDDVISWSGTYIPQMLNAIIDWFNKLPSRLVDIGKNMMKSIWNGILSMGDWLKNKVTDFFGGVGDGLSDALGIGKGTNVSVTQVAGFAQGGYPNSGELFFARENGIPEMVGRIGGRTAVANNDQISGAIEKAVVNGMLQILPYFSGQGQDLRVSLEGDVKGLFVAYQMMDGRKVKIAGT